MKLVTAQSLDDNIMMDFRQIRDKLEEVYFDDKNFIVVLNDDENFIQACQAYISNSFLIQMRIYYQQQVDYYEKVVFDFNEVERYFRAYYYDDESYFMENLHLWQKVEDLFSVDYNVQKIYNHKYVRMQLNDDDIIETLNHLQPTERLILSKKVGATYHFLLISLDTITGINQYSLNMKTPKKSYHKTTNNIEVVRNIVVQFLKNEKINFKDWQIS